MTVADLLFGRKLAPRRRYYGAGTPIRCNSARPG